MFHFQIITCIAHEGHANSLNFVHAIVDPFLSIVPLINVVYIYDILENDFGIKHTAKDRTVGLDLFGTSFLHTFAKICFSPIKYL